MMLLTPETQKAMMNPEGGLLDRGRADSYRNRPASPHFLLDGKIQPTQIPEQVALYMQGYVEYMDIDDMEE